MKKTILTVLLVVAGMQMNGCAATLSSHPYQDEYGNYGRSSYPENEYGQQGEFVYDDDYADVDWDSVEPDDMYYTYYDDDNVFLCTYGNRIFMIPYDYFYSNIWNHHRFNFCYYPYSYFANWWGVGFYNHVWDRYYWNRHNGQYRNGFDYYGHHRRYPPTVLRRGELRDPKYGRNSGGFNRYNRNSRTYQGDSYRSRSNRFSSRYNRYDSRSSGNSYSNRSFNRYSERNYRSRRASSGNSNSYRYLNPRSSGSSGYSTRGRGFSSSYGSSGRGRGGSSGYSTRGRGFSSSGSSGGGRGGYSSGSSRGSSSGSSHGHAVRKR